MLKQIIARDLGQLSWIKLMFEVQISYAFRSIMENAERVLVFVEGFHSAQATIPKLISQPPHTLWPWQDCNNDYNFNLILVYFPALIRYIYPFGSNILNLMRQIFTTGADLTDQSFKPFRLIRRWLLGVRYIVHSLNGKSTCPVNGMRGSAECHWLELCFGVSLTLSVNLCATTPTVTSLY